MIPFKHSIQGAAPLHARDILWVISLIRESSSLRAALAADILWCLDRLYGCNVARNTWTDQQPANAIGNHTFLL